MHIKELNATFGRLENETLSLSPGLNVIQAPNESGKSTWTTFLRIMLYGLNTRDRSPNAEKRRFMPWSGSAMQGRMELVTGDTALTIIRRTQRPTSPMGAFSAVYSGTATPADNLTATSCGEQLLGVPQEIFERSAFIRQTGMAVGHSAALEQRIAALISTGEEDTSYTDAADRLRKQLNARQSNRTTGQIPQLEQRIAAAQQTLEELSEMDDALQADLRSQQGLQQRQQDILHQLELHKTADWAQAAAQANDARDSFYRARQQADSLEAQTAALPPKETLEALRGELTALQALRQTAADAAEQAEQAAAAAEQAEAPLAAHPLARMTPDEAIKPPAPASPRPSIPMTGLLLSLLAGAGLAGSLFYLIRSIPLTVGCGTALALVLLLIAVILPLRHRQKLWAQQQADAAAQRQKDAAAYTTLYEAAAHAREAAQAAASSAEQLDRSCQDRLAQLLTSIHDFAPAAENTADAEQALDSAFAQLTQLERARQSAESARIRFELVEQHATDEAIPAIQRPLMSRQQLESILFDIQRKLTELQRQIHTNQGRIQAVADPRQLRAQLELLRQKRDQLQLEYEAIELASQVLSQVNTSLQNRFSPALGEKSAKIFTKLTKGKYNKVVLSKDMIPSAQESGQMLPHEAALLSQGTADQLYLAVRLAICQLVLPAKDPAPILLDDALVTFDDDRMAAALDYLTELAKDRQILLFTCQHRELDYLSQAHPGEYHAVSLNK